jgi:hypothetical protein
LSNLENFICLIKRAHFGTFSWPFADELCRMAEALLAEIDLKGDRVYPIIYVVREGRGYQIVYERQISAASTTRQFVVVAFPRSLKHHVLLHTIFGHELGHTALDSLDVGGVLRGAVLPALTAFCPMADNSALNDWVHATYAPEEVKDLLKNYDAPNKSEYLLNNDNKD